MDFSGLLLILFLDIVISAAMGGAIAYCLARIQHRQVSGWWKTAVLSASVFLVGLYGAHFVGFYWPSVTDAERYYGHPIHDGFALAIFLSVIFELCRYWKARSVKPH